MVIATGPGGITGAASPRVEGATVLDVFGNMRCLDVRRACQIGDGARQPQHAVIGPGRPLQADHGLLQQLRALGAGFAIPVHRAATQLTIGHALALPLPLGGGDHACGDGGAGLALARRAQLCGRQGGHLQLHVDPIQQGAGQALLVALDQLGRAAAAPGRVGVEATWAGVHGRDQLEARRKLRLARRP